MIRPFLVLVRAGTLFSPAADVIAGYCLLSGAGSALPWGEGTIARMIAASVLLYAAGMILNDHADRAIDAKLRPERPIPAGRIAASTALLLGAGALLAALALSPVRGYHGIMAGLILGYDYLIKANAPAGAITMGVLRGMNLVSPAALVEGGMGRDMMFEAAAGYGLYIVAVTFLGILEDADHVKRRTVLGLLTVPPITTTLVICALPERWPAPAITIGLALWFLARHRIVKEWTQGAIRVAMTHLLLGTMLFTGLIALGTGHGMEAGVIGGMLVVARVVARRVRMT